MKTFKTKNGTELILINLKGKDYLQVAYRLVWFREENPSAIIETEFVNLTDKFALCKATIKRDSGVIVATAHKREDASHFADFCEKSETGAIGRALALCGYGTQFCAEEFDEGSRIVDAPLEKKSNQKGDNSNASDFNNFSNNSNFKSTQTTKTKIISSNENSSEERKEIFGSDFINKEHPQKGVEMSFIEHEPMAGEQERSQIAALANTGGWTTGKIRDFMIKTYSGKDKVVLLTMREFNGLIQTIKTFRPEELNKDQEQEST